MGEVVVNEKMNYSISIINWINPLFFPILLVVGLLLAKAVYTYKMYEDLRRKAIKELFYGGLVLILVLGLFIVAPLTAGITIRDTELSLRLPTGFTFETYAKSDILSAEIINLDQSEYAIQSKIVGTRIRNYREGLFQLTNGAEAAVFLNGNTALLVHTNNHTLLLGPDYFDEFVKNFGEKLIPVNPSV